VVVAIPVGTRDAVERLARVADDVRCPLTPPNFSAVGQWYDDFSQTGDEEVRALLDLSRRD
jgi:putative phosphoribosyl transferase